MSVPRPKVKSIASTKSSIGLAWLASSEPRNIGELAHRMRQDYQIRLAESILSANIHAAKVTVNVTGDERAHLLGKHLERLWRDSLPAMLRCIGDGRVAFEKVWDYAAGPNLNFIRKLDPLPFAQTSMKITEGEFDGIDLDVGEREPLDIPPDNCWWLALDPTPLEPHGRSRFLGAPFAVWKERREAIRLRSVLRTRMIVSGGVAHIPMTETLENGQEIDNAVEMARAHDSRLAGSLMLLSNERDRDGNYLFDYKEPPSTLDLGPLDASIDGLDQEQLQAFGIPPKTVLEGDSTGSHAMVSQQMLTLYAVVEDILTQLENSFQKYVIEKELDHNFGPLDMPLIEIRHEPLADRPDTFQEDILKSALTGQTPSALLTCGAIDLKKMLEAAGIPLTEDAGDRLRDLLSQRNSPPGKEDAKKESCGCGGKGTGSVAKARQQPEDDATPNVPQDAARHGSADDFTLGGPNCGTGAGGFKPGNTCWRSEGRTGLRVEQIGKGKHLLWQATRNNDKLSVIGSYDSATGMVTRGDHQVPLNTLRETLNEADGFASPMTRKEWDDYFHLLEADDTDKPLMPADIEFAKNPKARLAAAFKQAAKSTVDLNDISGKSRGKSSRTAAIQIPREAIRRGSQSSAEWETAELVRL